MFPSEQMGFAVFAGYFLAKLVEWAKNSAHITWLNPDNTYLIQFLTAVASFLFSLGQAYLAHRVLQAPFSFDWFTGGSILWNALSAWVSAEITYHKTLKNEPKITVQLVATDAAGSPVFGPDARG